MTIGTHHVLIEWMGNGMNISEILENHKLWLMDNTKGKRADLRWANLRWANLRGADLSGAKVLIDDKELVINKTICLLQEKYSIIMLDTHMEIGCQKHLYSNWEKFTDDEISKMDIGALDWWKTWKPILFKIYRNSIIKENK